MVDVEQQIDELKKLTGTATIVDMAKVLGVATSTARGWKVREKVPESVMLKARQISQKKSAIPSGYMEIDYFDVEVSAGNGVLVPQEEQSNAIVFSERFICNEIGVNPKNIFLMPVKGDSMFPTLKNQSIIMVNKIDQLIEDGIYVFRYDGQLRVKRLQFSKSGIAVVSDNPAYQTWELNRDELAQADFEIIGEVVWSGQRM
ncbi:Putative Peptidase S24 LexA-like protein [Vibrio nigripulchritudo SFn27]|uniref:Putative Peptidase S24 LexA-like protein n=1 Tax=Vibrio nigripulchritudo TaxID=28173 RepID=U4KA02_9VIBR|nr:S24 family peptidase [Vibrio nigripulchritudo]CCN85494.1 Putative Peptidase S24 LexA-like protein [Vibrio nigripulchritudo BLFn1]CCN89037.1 Putative Peptidase S24 LexA-like protein [Vibrio nigripulchritudo SFn27]CCN95462.1 Putative Peptidase S24 LexA-like protein [Vibrio nigripulchritudo ENn2]CCO43220.1 Putative Peptidase S24 LexA-like protein [Vibrio nigripulchritudo SFn135]CCO54494.1 Putative Peptidase S24 LexA-like protein [Vibrio nigripulchritudo Wn13]